MLSVPVDKLPKGSVPSELVGVWQQTRASAGQYQNGLGENFDITQGFSVELRLRADGQYYLAHLAQGVSTTCGTVVHYEQSVGTAILDGTTLTLHPGAHRVDITDCSKSGARELPLDPISFTVQLQEATHAYGGLRTWTMKVDGGPHPYDLTMLFRAPLAMPVAPTQPSDFVLGTSGPFQELQGLFASAPGTDTGFYDPATSAFRFPELNGSPHAWIRFLPGGYETAVAFQNVNTEGACKLDTIFYEKGDGLFQVTEDVNNQGVHFLGHARFAATQARLLVQIRNCREDGPATARPAAQRAPRIRGPGGGTRRAGCGAHAGARAAVDGPGGEWW